MSDRQHREDQAAEERTADLGFARVDIDRARRTGDPEVVYGEGKTPEQVVEILTTLHARHPERAVLATRLSPQHLWAAITPEALRTLLTNTGTAAPPGLDDLANAGNAPPISVDGPSLPGL